MGRFFNTAGPCRADMHYMLPAAQRLPEVPWLIERLGYFVVHAPRQTGKTTTIEAIARELTRSGRYAALTVSCQSAGAAGEDAALAQQRVLAELRMSAEDRLPSDLAPPEWPDVPAEALRAGLRAWARACPRPVVLFLDEIDALEGRSLITVLSQLRTGHNDRPHAFPASVALCGMRDVRDYKKAAGGDSARLLSASPFNVAVESFRLGDFTVEQVARLYGQHTTETGQAFTDEGIEYAFELTRGQPWLVNALAREVVQKMETPADEAIGPRRLEAAKERLIRQRVTHLDSLAGKLNEPRVRRVIEPMITGEDDADEVRPAEPGASATDPTGSDTYDDDVCYVRDLGLVTRDRPVRIANPIYREVILRVLGARAEDRVTVDPRSFVLPDGRLDFRRLLDEFATFWKQHGEVLVRSQTYHEAAAQVVLMAFLHRIINGGGFLDREYGVGRGRIDLQVRWPYQDSAGRRVFQQEGMKLKVRRDGRPDPLDSGLEQLDQYLDRLELPTGTLVIFDRRHSAEPIHQRTWFDTASSPAGRTITLLRA